MRSTASAPGSMPQLYAALREEAQLAEALGYHSLWLAEHHFWYDGWCPSPLVAAASALAATSTLRVGTAIHLLPLFEPARIADELGWLRQLFGARIEYGVGLGYRAAEYDAYGLSRRIRGKRMDAALARLAEMGDAQPRIWVGGFAEKALERTARYGHGAMLPSTMRADQLTAAIDHVRTKAADVGTTVPIGIMKYAWPTDGSEEAYEAAVARLRASTREYWGSWFPLRGRPGFEVPDLLDAQLRRAAETALIGSPDQLLAGLDSLARIGAELCVLHIVGDARDPEHREAMTTIAQHVLPSVRQVAA